MKKEMIVVNGKEYPVFIHKEQRDSTRVSLGKTGVHIRVPADLPREQLFKKLLELKGWAKEKLQTKPIQKRTKARQTYSNGDILTIRDKEYSIKIEKKPNQGSSAHCKDDTIFLSIAEDKTTEEQHEHISVLLSRVIGKIHLPFISEKIHTLNKTHFDFPIKKIFLKYNITNWGSCSSNGNINISTRSLFAPDDVLDYVCIHELAHLQEQNHSDRFWQLVRKAMPNYEEKKKWLQENSQKCWF